MGGEGQLGGRFKQNIFVFFAVSRCKCSEAIDQRWWWGSRLCTLNRASIMASIEHSTVVLSASESCLIAIDWPTSAEVIKFFAQDPNICEVLLAVATVALMKKLVDMWSDVIIFGAVFFELSVVGRLQEPSAVVSAAAMMDQSVGDLSWVFIGLDWVGATEDLRTVSSRIWMKKQSLFRACNSSLSSCSLNFLFRGLRQLFFGAWHSTTSMQSSSLNFHKED